MPNCYTYPCCHVRAYGRLHPYCVKYWQICSARCDHTQHHYITKQKSARYARCTKHIHLIPPCIGFGQTHLFDSAVYRFWTIFTPFGIYIMFFPKTRTYEIFVGGSKFFFQSLWGGPSFFSDSCEGVRIFFLVLVGGSDIFLADQWGGPKFYSRSWEIFAAPPHLSNNDSALRISTFKFWNLYE